MREAPRNVWTAAGCRRGPCSPPTRGPGSRNSSRNAPVSLRGLGPGPPGTQPLPRRRRTVLLLVHPALPLPIPSVRCKMEELNSNLNLVFFNDYLVVAKPDLWIGQALPGRHMVFQSVPRAGNYFSI